MKAIRVNEVENFTRGGDPYKKMNVGSYYKPFIFMESLSMSTIEYSNIVKSKNIFTITAQNVKEDEEAWKRLFALQMHDIFKDAKEDEVPYKYLGYDIQETERSKHEIRVFGTVDVEILRDDYPVFREALRKFKGMTEEDIEFIYSMPKILKEVGNSLKETENFTRGGNPYKKLGIGLGYKVTLGIRYENDDAYPIVDNKDIDSLHRILKEFMEDLGFKGKYKYHSLIDQEWLGKNTVEIIMDVLVDDPEHLRTVLEDEWGLDEFEDGKSVGGYGWPRWNVVAWDGK